MWETLRVFGVRGLWFTIPAVSELPQGDQGRSNVLEVNDTKQQVQRSVDAEPPTPTPVIVRCCFSISIPLHADHLLNVGYVSVVC